MLGDNMWPRQNYTRSLCTDFSHTCLTDRQTDIQNLDVEAPARSLKINNRPVPVRDIYMTRIVLNQDQSNTDT